MRSKEEGLLRASKPLVSIVIPTYNEAPVIRETISRIKNILNKYNYSYEIIVVDDNSPDGTWKIVEEISNNDSSVRLLRRIGKRGLSSAVVDGAEIARGEYIVVMDADLQHPPEIIPALIREALRRNSDVVVASRYTRGGGVEGWSALRLLMSRGANLLARLLVPGARRTSDPMSGFFLIKKNIILSIKNELNLRGFKILFEILSKAGDLKVSEVPYVFRPRAAGKSKLGLLTIVDFIRQIIDNSLITKFAIVGMVGALVNLSVMAAGLMAGLSKELSSILGIETSILFNFVFNERWTFRFNFSKGWPSRLIGYHGSSLAGITVTFATMELTAEYGVMTPLEGQALGILLGFIANYLLASRGVWRWRRIEGGRSTPSLSKQ
jgi:dolichol-phosphate mannosyltransferase